MSIKVQDYERTVSKVRAVAIGPDGEPSLLSADKPAGTTAEKFTFTSGKLSTVEYFSTYDPNTQTGTLLATKNLRWNLDGTIKDIYWT